MNKSQPIQSKLVKSRQSKSYVAIINKNFEKYKLIKDRKGKEPGRAIRRREQPSGKDRTNWPRTRQEPDAQISRPCLGTHFR